MDHATLIRVRWDCETLLLLAYNFRQGMPPTERNIDTLDEIYDRLNTIVERGRDGDA